MAGMLLLPNEIITRISDYLPDKDLAHLAQVACSLNQTLSWSLLKRALEDKPPPVIKIPALLWAVHFGHTSLVRKIVLQPNFTTRGKDQALDLAAQLGDADMVPILIGAGYKVGRCLHTAIINGHASVVTQLLNHGALIHQRNSEKMTALVCAIHAPWTIWRKLRPKRISDQDRIQLIQVIEAQVISIIQILLSHGAHSQIRSADREGNTPLHHAVFQCLDSTVGSRVGAGILRLLVDAGASLSARNSDNYTPLELSVSYSTACSTALTFFLDIGLSPNTKFIDGHSLLSNALICTDEALLVIQVLLDRGATTDDINLWYFFHDQDCPDPILEKILTLLLIHGASFGKRANECFTFAAMLGMLGVMKMVLETCPGIDLNTSVSQNDGVRVETPLQAAISDGRADILQFLVECGVEMSQLEKEQVDAMLG